MRSVRRKSAEHTAKQPAAEVQPVEEKLTIFQIINSILDRSFDAKQSPQFESLYSPFFVNRALSMRSDTILIASLANRYAALTKEQHYDLTRGLIRPAKRRYVKWAKKQGVADDEKTVSMIQQIYQCNAQRAIEYIEVLGSDNVDRIVADYQHGRE